jgi:hypothetical protein
MIVAVICILIGCSQKSYWNKSGVTPQAYKADVADCKYRVYREATSGKIQSDRQSKLHEFNNCMESKEYSLIPRQYFIVGSGPNTKYYHRPDCPSVDNIPIQHQIRIKSAKELNRLWLEPCPRCKPPVDF